MTPWLPHSLAIYLQKKNVTINPASLSQFTPNTHYLPVESLREVPGKIWLLLKGEWSPRIWKSLKSYETSQQSMLETTRWLLPCLKTGHLRLALSTWMTLRSVAARIACVRVLTSLQWPPSHRRLELQGSHQNTPNSSGVSTTLTPQQPTSSFVDKFLFVFQAVASNCCRGGPNLERSSERFSREESVRPVRT